MMTKQSLRRTGLWLLIVGMIAMGLAWHFDEVTRDAASAVIRRKSQHATTDKGEKTALGERRDTAAAQSEAGLRAQVEFLSRQVTDLRAQAEQAERAAVSARRALVDAQGKLEQALKPLEQEMFSSALRTTVESGHTVITGGYQVPGGGFEYTMFKPILMTQDGRQVIMLEGKVMRVQKEQVASLGLNSLETNADNTLQHGEVWSPAQAGKFDSTVKTLSGGIDVLSYPRVMLSNGQEGQIEIGNYKAILKATVSEKGGAIQLDLRTEQHKAGESDQP
jgi:hypothetical protein